MQAGKVNILEEENLNQMLRFFTMFLLILVITKTIFTFKYP